ncbi:NAD(P)H dehydrogenase C1 [Zea mays]|uniref:NAD(P)H dehydrogenase C1 n=1 Tax=Zea mays TaxID=4577 RepID=A0A1D6NSA5_MAIZE|nr:NAD(P)H dehydrogenase C1 [Zea mays]
MGDSTATNPSSPTAAMDPDSEVVFDFPPYLCQYKSGRIHRPGGAPTVPAGTDPATGVVSKDIRAGPASARVYLPPGAAGKIPVVVYFHGGGFVVGSPARPGTHNYLNDLVARSGAIGVSVYYRLAPEHKLPAAYDDAWAALRWAATLGGGEDPWLLEHADLSRVFLAGCSAGANIAHNTARAPRRRDHPRARRGAPLLHGQRGRGRRDSLRPRDPAVHGPHLAVRGLRHGGAGRPAREPVRGRRGAQGLRGDPVPARAGVRGRERLPAQGARAVVPPGDQGQRVRWRGRAVRV